MRKKSSYSEENFLQANSAKVSEYFRQNPRLPKKMKSVKAKYPNPMIRTVGQLNSCGGKTAFTGTTTSFGFQNMSNGEPVRKQSEHDDPWSKLHRTFSNSQTPSNFPHIPEYPVSEPARFCSVTKVKDDHQTESQEPASVSHKTSESGVQVNMFHCKECRRHIKYGKNFKLENSCTESDSENNQLASTGCTNCERKQDTINLSVVDDNGEDDEEKSETEEPLFQRHISPCNHVCTPRERSPPREHHSPTPRVDSLPRNGGKQIWLTNIKLMTVAIIIIPLVLHIIQIQSISTTISEFNFFLRSLIQEETEDQPSVVNWVIDLFFGVQGLSKPLPLFLYLF